MYSLSLSLALAFSLFRFLSLSISLALSRSLSRYLWEGGFPGAEHLPGEGARVYIYCCLLVWFSACILAGTNVLFNVLLLGRMCQCWYKCIVAEAHVVQVRVPDWCIACIYY